MKRIGTIQHENYVPDKLEVIFRRIEIASKANQGLDYEMLLDNLKVVPRTSDPEKFNSFSEFITQDSECLTVYVYYGASKQYDTYFFHFKGIPVHKAKSPYSSSNPEVVEWEKQQRDKILKELYHERLEKENKELRLKLQESEEKYSTQEQYWEKIRSGKLDSYGEIGSAIVVKLLNNPNIQKMIPGGDILNGILQPTQNPAISTSQNAPENETASFSRAEETEEKNIRADTNLSEEDLNYLQFLRDVSEHLDEQQLEVIMDIIRQLTLNPVVLKSTSKHIRNFLNSKPKI